MKTMKTMSNKPKRGGARPKTRPDDARGGPRPGAGRPPKGGETRIQKSVSLSPQVWLFLAQFAALHGCSESDALEKMVRSHILFQEG